MATKKDATKARIEQDRLRAFRERQAAHARQDARRRHDNILWSIVGIVVVAVAVTAQVVFTVAQPYSAHAKPSATPSAAAAPNPSLAENRTWTGTLDLNGIPLGIELYGDKAPQAVASTISLAQSGFYDQLSCHRLTTSGIFVLQCGDPNGDGTGGPGYSYGPVENAPVDNFYPAGTIAMARQGGKADSNGSQFFIVYKDSTIPADAAGGYTVIGRVTSGMDRLMTDIIDKGVQPDGGSEKPLVDTVITAFTLK